MYKRGSAIMSQNAENIRATVSANILVRNEVRNIDSLIQNLLDAEVDEIVFLDGGSCDGTWEKLKAWSQQNPRIIPLLWPQRDGSEYKREFNEVARRNLMIEASTSDFILYIDADERISLDFKNKIDPHADCVAVMLTSFWDGRVRINGLNDTVWFPDLKFRIFKRCAEIRFKSSDANGLHNYLSWKGLRIPLGMARGGHHVLLARVIRSLMPLRARVDSSPPRIFHYHYYDLSRKKVNDLRAAEFGWPIKMEPSSSSLKEEQVVYVANPVGDDEADEITRRYWI